MGGLGLARVVGQRAVADRIVSIRCPCGFEVRSRSEDEVIRMARSHASEIHGQELTEEQARALIEVAA